MLETLLKYEQTRTVSRALFIVAALDAIEDVIEYAVGLLILKSSSGGLNQSYGSDLRGYKCIGTLYIKVKDSRYLC